MSQIEAIGILSYENEGDAQASVALARGSHKELITDAWGDLNAKFDARDPEALALAEEGYAGKFLSYWQGKMRIFLGAAGVESIEAVPEIIGRPIEIGNETAVFSNPTSEHPSVFAMERVSPEGVDKVTLSMHKGPSGRDNMNVNISSVFANVNQGKNIISIRHQIAVADGGFDIFAKTENVYQHAESSRANATRVESLYLPDVRG